MAVARTTKKKTGRKKAEPRRALTGPILAPWRWLKRWALRMVLIVAAVFLGVVIMHAMINPGRTFYMKSEARRLGSIDQLWVSIDDVAPVMARSVVAAEDANFCLHWGFDVEAIRAALEEGEGRGASTIDCSISVATITGRW